MVCRIKSRTRIYRNSEEKESFLNINKIIAAAMLLTDGITCNPGAFLNVARPGGGAFAYLGLTPGHLTRFQNRGVSRVFVMEAFIGQDVDYVAD